MWQKTLHLRTLKSWGTHSEPEKKSREYNITNVILIKVNFIMVFGFCFTCWKNGFPRNIPMRLHLLLFYSSKHDPQKKRDKKHRRILRLNFSDFPWKLRIKKSHRMHLCAWDSTIETRKIQWQNWRRFIYGELPQQPTIACMICLALCHLFHILIMQIMR